MVHSNGQNTVFGRYAERVCIGALQRVGLVFVVVGVFIRNSVFGSAQHGGCAAHGSPQHLAGVDLDDVQSRRRRLNPILIIAVSVKDRRFVHVVDRDGHVHLSLRTRRVSGRYGDGKGRASAVVAVVVRVQIVLHRQLARGRVDVELGLISPTQLVLQNVVVSVSSRYRLPYAGPRGGVLVHRPVHLNAYSFVIVVLILERRRSVGQGLRFHRVGGHAHGRLASPKAIFIRHDGTQVHAHVVSRRRTGLRRGAHYVRPRLTIGRPRPLPLLVSLATVRVNQCGHQAPARLWLRLVQSHLPSFVHVRYSHHHLVLAARRLQRYVVHVPFSQRPGGNRRIRLLIVGRLLERKHSTCDSEPLLVVSVQRPFNRVSVLVSRRERGHRPSPVLRIGNGLVAGYIGRVVFIGDIDGDHDGVGGPRRVGCRHHHHVGALGFVVQLHLRVYLAVGAVYPKGGRINTTQGVQKQVAVGSTHRRTYRLVSLGILSHRAARRVRLVTRSVRVLVFVPGSSVGGGIILHSTPGHLLCSPVAVGASHTQAVPVGHSSPQTVICVFIRVCVHRGVGRRRGVSNIDPCASTGIIAHAASGLRLRRPLPTADNYAAVNVRKRGYDSLTHLRLYLGQLNRSGVVRILNVHRHVQPAATQKLASTGRGHDGYRVGTLLLVVRLVVHSNGQNTVFGRYAERVCIGALQRVGLVFVVVGVFIRNSVFGSAQHGGCAAHGSPQHLAGVDLDDVQSRRRRLNPILIIAVSVKDRRFVHVVDRDGHVHLSLRTRRVSGRYGDGKGRASAVVAVVVRVQIVLHRQLARGRVDVELGLISPTQLVLQNVVVSVSSRYRLPYAGPRGGVLVHRPVHLNAYSFVIVVLILERRRSVGQGLRFHRVGGHAHGRLASPKAIFIRHDGTQVHAHVVSRRRTGLRRGAHYVRPRLTIGRPRPLPLLVSLATVRVNQCGHQAPARLWLRLVQSHLPSFVHVRYSHHHLVLAARRLQRYVVHVPFSQRPGGNRRIRLLIVGRLLERKHSTCDSEPLLVVSVQRPFNRVSVLVSRRERGHRPSPVLRIGSRAGRRLRMHRASFGTVREHSRQHHADEHNNQCYNCIRRPD